MPITSEETNGLLSLAMVFDPTLRMPMFVAFLSLRLRERHHRNDASIERAVQEWEFPPRRESDAMYSDDIPSIAQGVPEITQYLELFHTVYSTRPARPTPEPIGLMERIEAQRLADESRQREEDLATQFASFARKCKTASRDSLERRVEKEGFLAAMLTQNHPVHPFSELISSDGSGKSAPSFGKSIWQPIRQPLSPKCRE